MGGCSKIKVMEGDGRRYVEIPASGCTLTGTLAASRSGSWPSGPTPQNTRPQESRPKVANSGAETNIQMHAAQIWEVRPYVTAQCIRCFPAVRQHMPASAVYITAELRETRYAHKARSLLKRTRCPRGAAVRLPPCPRTHRIERGLPVTSLK